MKIHATRFAHWAGLALLTSVNAWALTPPVVANSPSPQLLSLKFPQANDNLGAPRTTTGGGVRSGGGQCQNVKDDELSLNVLTPNFGLVATTASQTPSLFFYLPPQQAQAGEVSLSDETGNLLYRAEIALPQKAGIIQVPLRPKNGLSSDNFYIWSLRLICNREERSEDILLQGELEYRPLAKPLPTLAGTKNEQLRDQAKFYAEQGIWLDALAALAPLRSSQPEEMKEFLSSAGLSVVLPFDWLDCCQSPLQSNSVSP